jgi:serine/threonine-protein kinase
LIGQRVERHEIVRPLGAGGMGEVYLARADDGTLRALKLVRGERAADPKSLARFRREALALGRLRHDGIVQIVDAGQQPDGGLYLAMEYVAGPDLQATITADGPFALGDAIALLAQVADALAYAHALGVVHRDLKPSNVLLPGGDPARAKIIDFGLAKLAADEGLTRLTEDQQVLGSPLYWAPEQSASANVGAAADVYALGGLAYFVLSGAPIFSPRPAVALVHAHVHERPEPLAARCRDLAVPPELAALVAACVEKVPAARPAATAVRDQLARLAAAAPATGQARRPRLFSGAESSALAEAVENQIRQVVLELAAVVGLPTDELDRVQDELAERELELAMAEPGAAGDRLAHAVAQLQREVGAAHRALLGAVDAARQAAPADAHPLYDELDALVERYRAR